MSGPKPSSAAHPHRVAAPSAVPTAVITVSDTRTPETDTGGQRVADLLAGAGHPVVVREIVADDRQAIASALRVVLGRAEVRAVILTALSPLSRNASILERACSTALAGACRA